MEVHMSTLYNRYLQLKQEKCDVYYLFKYGIFYIFLDDDAKDISKLFNFKLTNLNASVVKCGFPASQLNKYLAYFRGSNISVKIIESTQSPVLSDYTYVYYKKCDSLIENIAKIDPETLSVSEAFNTLQKFARESTELMEYRKAIK